MAAIEVGTAVIEAPVAGVIRIGVEPAVEMLRWTPQVAPGAQFLSARAESLPFRDGAFDLIVCALAFGSQTSDLDRSDR